MNSKILLKKRESRQKRKLHIRKNVSGNSARPRLTVFKSNKHFYAQAIDDTMSHTLAHVTTINTKEKGSEKILADLATKMAEQLKEHGIEQVVYDRNGYKFHGLVKMFAESLRESGIKI